MSDLAASPGVSTAGSIYAMVTANTPEYRKIIKIEMTPDGPQSKVVQDYKLVKSISDMVSKAMAETADSDDTPQEQQLLMSAWQALAMYLSTCDDEDKAPALQVLKMVSNLMSDGPDDGPLPTGTFGATTQSAAKTAVKGKGDMQDANDPKSKLAPPFTKKKRPGEKAANTYDCPQCSRNFSTEQGMINHLKSLHAAREKQTKATPANDKD